ncbi:hypothetical protein ABEY43_07230 [Priestia megaterium]
MEIENVLFYRTIGEKKFLPNTTEEIALIKEAVVSESSNGLCFRNCKLTEYQDKGLDYYASSQKPLFMKMEGEKTVTVKIIKKWQEAWMGFNIDVDIIE